MIIKGPVEYRLMKKNNGALVLQGLMVAINENWREWRDILTENETPTCCGTQKEGEMTRLEEINERYINAIDPQMPQEARDRRVAKLMMEDVPFLFAALAEKEYEITIWKDRYASLEIRHDSLKKEYAEADRTEGGVG
jgi:hypothetical protein